VVQADLEAQGADMWVVNIDGQPWWETIVNGVTLRSPSGARLAAVRKTLAGVKPPEKH